MQDHQNPCRQAGEGNNARFATAIAGTVRNPGDALPFIGTFSKPPTPSELQTFAA